MTPFDLKKALDGAKLVTRSGIEVLKFENNPNSIVYPFSAVFLGDMKRSYDESGRFINSQSESPLDLFLADDQSEEVPETNSIYCVRDMD